MLPVPHLHGKDGYQTPHQWPCLPSPVATHLPFETTALATSQEVPLPRFWGISFSYYSQHSVFIQPSPRWHVTRCDILKHCPLEIVFEVNESYIPFNLLLNTMWNESGLYRQLDVRNAFSDSVCWDGLCYGSVFKRTLKTFFAPFSLGSCSILQFVCLAFSVHFCIHIHVNTVCTCSPCYSVWLPWYVCVYMPHKYNFF